MGLFSFALMLERCQILAILSSPDRHRDPDNDERGYEDGKNSISGEPVNPMELA